jgi:glycosyltransferase involved in cell wall biosynthesis
MPTLAEGGGSFPVWEALLLGIPVVCSDIPVLREQMERVGASVLWIDPRDPAQLAARLHELDADYARYKALAREQISRLQHRSWGEVAEEYRAVFETVAAVHQDRS